jgi:hypothetical protein
MSQLVEYYDPDDVLPNQSPRLVPPKSLRTLGLIHDSIHLLLLLAVILPLSAPLEAHKLTCLCENVCLAANLHLC